MIKRERIIGLTERHRLPAVYPFACYFKPQATSISSWPKTGRLCVQRYELSINVKCRQDSRPSQLVLTLLASADQVIEEASDQAAPELIFSS